MTNVVTEILTPAEIEVLRGGFSDSRMLSTLTQVLRETYAPMGGFLDWTQSSLYNPDVLSPRDRERTLIALLCSQPMDTALSVHLYWGLVAGLSPGEIAQTLMLCGTYLGVPAYSRGVTLFQQVLHFLKTRAREGGDAVACVPLTRALLARHHPA